MDRLDFIIAFEGGSDEEITLQDIKEHFQAMIDDDIVWQLQGFYGRTANTLINQGICHLPEQKESN